MMTWATIARMAAEPAGSGHTQQLVSIVLGVLAAAGGGGVTWLVARRKTSGRVNTTEAETLWSESQKMRQELRDEVAGLRIEADNLRSENDRLQGELSTAHSRMAEFGLKLAHAQEKVAVYEKEIDRLVAKLPEERRATERVVTATKAEQAALRAEQKVQKK